MIANMYTTEDVLIFAAMAGFSTELSGDAIPNLNEQLAPRVSDILQSAKTNGSASLRQDSLVSSTVAGPDSFDAVEMWVNDLSEDLFTTAPPGNYCASDDPALWEDAAVTLPLQIPIAPSPPSESEHSHFMYCHAIANAPPPPPMSPAPSHLVDDYVPRTRAEAVARYLEKKARRVHHKRIRYQMRKLNADKRPRVKGRFIKREEAARMRAEGLL